MSNNLGRTLSIQASQELIKKKYGRATYKNIYNTIQGLADKNILKIERIGRSSITHLNFDNLAILDFLSEMELIKKRRLLEKRQELQLLLFEMENYFSQGFYFIESISIIKPERNFKLNKAEFLFILKEPFSTATGNNWGAKEDREQRIENEIKSIYSIMKLLQGIHNIKLDFLILREEKEFFELLKEQEKNALKEMLSDKTTFYSPQDFWISIKRALNQGINIRAEKELKLNKISEKDLFYNLNRFGYSEFGEQLRPGITISIESTIAAILLQDDARRKEAIPIILSKAFDNKSKRQPNYNLLIFLCNKYGKLPELFGLLKAFNKIKPLKETEKAINLIKQLDIKEKKADLKSLKEKMRLYNAI